MICTSTGTRLLWSRDDTKWAPCWPMIVLPVSKETILIPPYLDLGSTLTGASHRIEYKGSQPTQCYHLKKRVLS